MAFYLLGFAETVLETYGISVVQMLPFIPDEWGGLDPGGHASYADTVLVGSGANLAVLAISIVGASAFARASFLIFLVIVSALLAAVASFFAYTPASPHVAGLNFTGPSLATLKENWGPGYQCAATPCAADEADLAHGGWDAARVAQQAAAVEVGKSGMDEAAAPDAAAAAADAVCTACDAENTVPNRVFWDAACHACYAEISMIQKLGEKQDLEFVDISAPDFDARKDQYIDGATTPYAVEMIGEFDGVQTVGVETFRRMYAQIFPRVGTPIVSVSRLPGIAHAAEAGYWMFAHLIRPNLPKRRVAVCTAACDAKKQKQT